MRIQIIHDLSNNHEQLKIWYSSYHRLLNYPGKPGLLYEEDGNSIMISQQSKVQFQNDEET